MARLTAEIRRRNPGADVRLVDTVCSPTKARGAALEALLPQVDALVVVGGRDSNNTRQLALRAERRGVPAVRVERADELDAAWLTGRRRRVGHAASSGLIAVPRRLGSRRRAVAAPTS